MPQPQVWFEGNDMVVAISGVRSSTMASTAYLNSSTGVRVTIYDGPTTSDSAIISNRQLSYVTATNGTYQNVIQSTEGTAWTRGDQGLAVFSLAHSGMNGKWWLPFRVDLRRTS